MMSTSVAVEANNLRPSRLNVAGWCIYCATRNCTDARCIANHTRSEWGVCGKCGGSEWVDGHIDPETATQRCDCFGGLTEVMAPDAEVIELRPFVVTYPPRPVAKSGLCAVCRSDHAADGADHAFEPSEESRRVDTVEPWDYHAAARRAKDEARARNPELVAFAEAHPNNPSAQWAAYGTQY